MDLRDRLTLKSQKFSDDKINFNFDPNLEKEEIRANIQFKNERERENIIEKIKSFRLKIFKNLSWRLVMFNKVFIEKSTASTPQVELILKKIKYKELIEIDEYGDYWAK